MKIWKRQTEIICCIITVGYLFTNIFIYNVIANQLTTNGYILNWHDHEGEVPGTNCIAECRDSAGRGICECYNIHLVDGNSVIKTTYNDWGFSALLKVDGISLWMGRAKYLGESVSEGDYIATNVNGVYLKSIDINNEYTDASGHQFTQIKFHIYNSNNYTKTFSLATTCDLQVGTDDNAYCRSIVGSNGDVTGFTTSNILLDAALWKRERCYSLNVFTNDTPGATNADNVCITGWQNQYSDAFINNVLNNVGYTANNFPHYGTTGEGGIDTGFTIGWQDRTIQPGETVTLSYILGVSDFVDSYTQTNNYYKMNESGEYVLFDTKTVDAAYGEQCTAENVAAPDGTCYSHCVDNMGSTIYSSTISYTVTGDAVNSFYYNGCDQFVWYHSNDDYNQGDSDDYDDSGGNCLISSYGLRSDNRTYYNMFERVGYSFHDWNTRNDMSGDTYLEYQRIENFNCHTRIRTAADPSCTLDVLNNSQASGTNVGTYYSNDTDAQFFSFHYEKTVDGVPYWTIVNTRSGLVLDIENGILRSGTNVRMYTPNGSDAQLWTVYPADEQYCYIKAKGGEYYLALETTGPICNVQLNTFQDTPAQKWSLADITLNLYANWVADEVIVEDYTIHYEPNASLVANVPSDVLVDRDQYVQLSSEVPIRSGWKFIGWNLKQDGTGTIVQPGDEIINLAEEGQDIVNLYAIWRYSSFHLIKASSNRYQATILKRTDGDEGWYQSSGSMTYLELSTITLDDCVQVWKVNQMNETTTAVRIK